MGAGRRERVVGRDRKRVGASGGRVPAAVAFLEAALARCAVAVADLEVSARADRLLGERQSITDSKKFRAAKNKLSVASRRDGFGRGGEWSWALPASLTVDPAETAADITPEVPTSVIYADHSRPVRSGNADQTTSTGVLSAPIEPTQTGRIPLDHRDRSHPAET